jgi:hypothetical protein
MRQQYAVSSATAEVDYIDGWLDGISFARVAPQGKLLGVLKRLVERCDGDEGVRADGSNIDTREAHAVIDKTEGRHREEAMHDTPFGEQLDGGSEVDL